MIKSFKPFAAILALLAVCFWVSSFLVEQYFDSHFPIKPQPAFGRLVPLNTHGSIVYITWGEFFFLYGLMFIAILFFFLAFIAIEAESKNAQKTIIGLGVSMPTIILVLFVGSAFNNFGIIFAAIWGLIPAFLFGQWISRHNNGKSIVFWGILPAVLPFIVSFFNDSYPFGREHWYHLGWGWDLVTVTTFLAVMAGQKISQFEKL